jgi:hypothetical protein
MSLKWHSVAGRFPSSLPALWNFAATNLPRGVLAGVIAVFVCIFAVDGESLLAAAEGGGSTTGAWRLLRTTNPRGGPDAVSMIRTADMTRSDIDLAGMLLKCGEHGIDVVVVAVTPFPPRARPEVIIGISGKELRFTASVVPPGAELQLPAEATGLVSGTWRTARELAIKVVTPERTFGGVVPVEGLGDALSTLSTNCPAGERQGG